MLTQIVGQGNDDVTAVMHCGNLEGRHSNLNPSRFCLSDDPLVVHHKLEAAFMASELRCSSCKFGMIGKYDTLRHDQRCANAAQKRRLSSSSRCSWAHSQTVSWQAIF
eukprot:6039025-Amphidinium_carterae.2